MKLEEKIQKTKQELDLQYHAAYKEHYMSIYKFCLSQLYGNVEYSQDCTQEAFRVLYEKLLGGEIISNVRALLYSIARNFIKRRISQIMREKKRLVPLDEDNIENDSSSEFNIEIGLQEEEINPAKALEIIFTLLSKEECLLYQQYFREKLTIQQLAEDLNISPNYISVKIHRLKIKMKAIIQDLIKEKVF